MKHFSNQEILTGIKNGNDDVLVYLARQYFAPARRLLRMRGLRDSETPAAFAGILASGIINLFKRKTVTDIDFESYFFNSLNKYSEKSRRRKRKNNDLDNTLDSLSDQPAQVAAQCVSILDEPSQKLLFARVVEKMSYEKIAERFKYSNAVIAQYELDKIFTKLEGIVKLRMDISQN